LKTSTFQEITGVYVHGPMPLLEKPVNLKILETLFGQEGIISIEVSGKHPEPVSCNPDGTCNYGIWTLPFSINSKLFKQEYRLFSHPWGGARPKPPELFEFPPLHKIIGAIVAFKWFDYQTQQTYKRFLNLHLQIALSSKMPVKILIDTSPPMKNAIEIVKEVREDGLHISTIEEGPIEEALKLYKLPNQSEIDTFAQLYDLNEDNLMCMDVTQYQSVFDAVIRSVSFFENQCV
jgi:hypothetical protein